jgi:hypothetical protein
MADTRRIDPRVFIHAPYIHCPGCGKDDYGVLEIGGRTYTRRCRECRHTSRYPVLSTIRKKVIYIDQCAISNMMKALDVTSRAHDRAAADPFWLSLFEQLERVCKLQLAVCPESHAHNDESLVSPFYDALKRMYEQLSRGVTFDSPQQIEQRQMNVALAAWLACGPAVHDLNAEGVTSGDLHGWQSRLIVSVGGGYPPDLTEAIRSSRNSIAHAQAEWFEGCRARKDRSFDHALRIELEGCRDGLITAYRNWLQSRLEIALGQREFEVADVMPSSAVQQVRIILEILRQRGEEGRALMAKLFEFLESDAFRDTPSNRVSTRLFAVIAHQAANGRKRQPSRGMSNDIQIVSSLMPYCDAMFVDNECRIMIESIPKRHALGFATRIFSQDTRDVFLEFLRAIESSADAAHLEEVRSVYGDNWPRPFHAMYDVQRQMDERRGKR